MERQFVETTCEVFHSGGCGGGKRGGMKQFYLHRKLDYLVENVQQLTWIGTMMIYMPACLLTSLGLTFNVKGLVV